jgi:dolichol-phosphate mannosyltransferase
MTSAQDFKILVVVPTYEEADNIDELVASIHRHAPSVDLLFVDDNSQDGTREAIENHQRQHPDNIHLLRRASKLGLGTAYVDGFRWALDRGYEVLIEMDADLSHDPAHLPAFFQSLRDHDVVVGSRYIKGGATRNWSLLRQMISRFGSFYARTILSLKVKDPTGGYNAWHRRVLETLGLESIRSEGYSFQIELKYRASRAGFSLVETPIVFADRRAGQSKLSGRVVWEAVFRVWALRMQK